MEAEHADPAPGPGTSVPGPSVSTLRVSGTSVLSASVWRIHAGETLRQALSRWGERAGSEVTFLTDRRYRIDGSAAFEGGFGDAAAALLRGLAHLPHPPAGALSADGRSLTVTHRVRRSPEAGSKQ